MRRIESPRFEDVDQIKPKITQGERRVFELFRTCLAPEWEIYFNPHLNGLRPDFVLLNPRVGIAVYEIKDWELRRDNVTREGHHHLRRTDGQGRTWREPDPLDKVKHYREEILSLYCPSLDRGKESIAVLTAGVIFTKTSGEVLASLYPSDRPQQLPVVGRECLTARGVETIVPDLHRVGSMYMRPDLADELRHWLVEPDAALEQRLLPRLTRSQSEVMINARSVRRRRVKGAAGSGKSLALVGRAAWLTRRERDVQHKGEVLVVCFNITLVGYLRDSTRPFFHAFDFEPQRITYLHWHAWARRAMQTAGCGARWKEAVQAHGPNAPALGDTVASTLAGAELAGVARYDAILVDEGQDLEPEWWDALRTVLRDPEHGELLLVADDAQDIYDRGTSWTDRPMEGLGFSGPWLRLEGSHRLPSRLIDVARSIAGGWLGVPEEDLPAEPAQTEIEVEPVRLRWVNVNEEEVGNAVRSATEEMLAASRGPGLDLLAWADIVIVADTLERGRQALASIPNTVARIHTYDADERIQRRRKMVFFKGDGRLKATTIHSIKGWECSALVVIVGPNSGRRAASLLYTALTRLKRRVGGSHLTVVCADPTFEPIGRLFGPEADGDCRPAGGGSA